MKPPYLQRTSKTFVIDQAPKKQKRPTPEAQNKFTTHVPEHCFRCFVAAPPRGHRTGWQYTPKGLLCPKDAK